MSRSPAQVRDATPEDAEALLSIWADFSKRMSSERFSTEAPEVVTAAALARIAADPDERLLVAVVGDRIVGTMHARRAPLSPIHTENAIHTSHLHVLGKFRRHGVGRALMETAVTWAEEKDTAHLIAVTSASARDANRFMARLGLAQIAVVRCTTVAALRARLPVDAAAAARVAGRSSHHVGQVLAQRRSLRRAQSKFL